MPAKTGIDENTTSVAQIPKNRKSRNGPWWILVAKFGKFSSKEPVLKKRVSHLKDFWPFCDQTKILVKNHAHLR